MLPRRYLSWTKTNAFHGPSFHLCRILPDLTCLPKRYTCRGSHTLSEELLCKRDISLVAVEQCLQLSTCMYVQQFEVCSYFLYSSICSLRCSHTININIYIYINMHYWHPSPEEKKCKSFLRVQSSHINPSQSFPFEENTDIFWHFALLNFDWSGKLLKGRSVHLPLIPNRFSLTDGNAISHNDQRTALQTINQVKRVDHAVLNKLILFCPILLRMNELWLMKSTNGYLSILWGS